MSSKIVRHLDALDFKNYKNLSSEKIVIVVSCSAINEFFEGSTNDSSEKFEYYYMLDEPFNSYYLKMLMPSYSLFYHRLQELSLRVFESGIKKGYTPYNPVNDRPRFEELNVYESADYFLVLADIIPVFYLLGFGLAAAILAFLMEIFWHDFLIKLDICGIVTKLRFFLRRFAFKRSLKVQVTQVAPKS